MIYSLDNLPSEEQVWLSLFLPQLRKNRVVLSDLFRHNLEQNEGGTIRWK